MKSVFMFVLLADMIISSSSTTLSNTYKALYGFNWMSSKTNMAIVEVASRVRCGHICDRILGCGGFNFRSVTTGLFQCEFKQGISSAGDGMTDNSGTYYQKTDQDPCFTSRDCADLQNSGVTVSGVYKVNLDPDGAVPQLIDVYCDVDTDNGGWLVLLRREDGSLDFDRNWAEYKKGFGDYYKEYWLGLESGYLITNNGRSYKLRVDITLFNGDTFYATYNNFVIGSESEGYALHVSGYAGTAGDALAYHDTMKFSTKDVDNDQAGINCAEIYYGGFWYKACSDARLTARYGQTVPDTIYYGSRVLQGIFWTTNLGDEHPKYVDMKIRA